MFVTADEEQALEAFDLEATDYLLKPLAESRLERAISRIIGTANSPAPAPVAADETITAMVGSSLRRIRRADVGSRPRLSA